MVCFHTLISLLKLYVSVTGEQFKLHTVVNALGSVVDMYQLTSTLVKQPLACLGVRAAYTCLLTLSDLVIYLAQSHFYLSCVFVNGIIT